MIKKIFFILTLTISLITFSQGKSIEKLSAAPNPFSNSTKITFESIDNSPVIFIVKNILGTTVFKENLKTKAGYNLVSFYKGNLKTGMYIYSLQNKKKIISKRLVIK